MSRVSPIRWCLDEYDDNYLEVSQLFQRTSYTKDYNMKILAIEKVENRTLLSKFEQKKEEYKFKFGHVRVEKVFHGTKKENIPSILINNLEVQRYGDNLGCRFGAGVSFSAFASYSSHYCDKSSSGDQMLLCHVLISNMKEVPEAKRRGAILKEPPFIEGRYPLRYDTTTKDKKTLSVIVKFENHTFYPAFVIHFVKVPKVSSSLFIPDYGVSKSSKSFVSTIPERARELSPPHQSVLKPRGVQISQAASSQVASAHSSREQRKVLQSTQPSKPPRGRIASPASSSTAVRNEAHHVGIRSVNGINFSSPMPHPTSSGVSLRPALLQDSSHRPHSYQPISATATSFPVQPHSTSTRNSSSSGCMDSLRSFLRRLFCIGNQTSGD